jgi:hypothetical protein
LVFLFLTKYCHVFSGKVEKRRMEDDLMKQIANVKDPVRVKEIVETYRKRQQRRSIVAEGGRGMCTQDSGSGVW